MDPSQNNVMDTQSPISKAKEIISKLERPPIIAMGLSGVMVLFWFLGAVIDSVPGFLALIPARTLGYLHVWNIFTGALYHKPGHVLDLVFDCIQVMLSTKVLLTIWGHFEFIRFIILIGSVTNLIIVLWSGLLYSILGFSDIFDPNGGFFAISVASAVAMKQLQPELELGIPSLRAKHLPFIYVTFSLMLSFLRGGFHLFLLGFIGFHMSWIYLRYFQQLNQNARGDQSEAFEYHNFFPEMIQPLVRALSALLSNYVFFCLKKTPKPNFSYSSAEMPPIPLQHLNSENDRRRQLGVKALDEKLAKMKNLPVYQTLDTTSTEDAVISFSQSTDLKSSDAIESI